MVHAQELQDEFGVGSILSNNLEHFFNDTMEKCKILRTAIDVEMSCVECRNDSFALESMRILSQAVYHGVFRRGIIKTQNIAALFNRRSYFVFFVSKWEKKDGDNSIGK